MYKHLYVTTSIMLDGQYSRSSHAVHDILDDAQCAGKAASFIITANV